MYLFNSMTKKNRTIPIFGILLFSFLIITLNSCKDTFTEYYHDGKLKAEIELKDNVKNGVAKWYYPNGTVKMEGTYFNDKLEGLFKEYYETGELEKEGYFKDDVQQGMLKVYYKSGNLQTMQFFKNGIPDSTYESYHSNGQLKMEALKNKGKTYYYTEYDSLGNFLNEFRYVHIDCKDTIVLGEDITIEVSIFGPKLKKKAYADVFLDILYNEEPYEKNIEKIKLPINENQFTQTIKAPKNIGYYSLSIMVYYEMISLSKAKFNANVDFWVIEKEDKLVER